MWSGEKSAGFGLWAGAAMVWLAVCSAAVCVALLGVLSVERLRSPVEVEASYVALVVGQVFFLVFLWPLFERRHVEGRFCGVAAACARLVGMLLLSAPLVLVTLRTAEADFADVTGSQLVVLFIGMSGGALIRLPGARRWYYPGAYFVSAAVPLAAYLLYEEGGHSPCWAAAVCPFWAAGGVASGAPLLAPLLVFGCLACGAVFGLLWRAGAADQR